MNNEVSKKQFIIITLVVLVITVAVVVTILKNKTPANINNSIDVSASDNGVSQIEPSSMISASSIIGVASNDVENENEIENNNIEIPINTNNTSETLTKLQSDIEVLTDKDKEVIFKNMITPSEKEIKSYMKIDTTLLDEYIIRIDQNKFSSRMYMILKPYESGKAEVISQIKQYLSSYSSAWSELNVEQYQIIQDKTAVERNGYLIYVISTDNDTVMNTIRKVI